MTLTEFLLARIAEDEAAAREAKAEQGGAWEAGSQANRNVYAVNDPKPFAIGTWGGDVGEAAVHIARHDPARVLAECEAKRRIVELADWLDNYAANVAVPPVLSDRPSRLTLRLLALPYANHPDYDEAWRV